jgi:hypothetical protein
VSDSNTVSPRVLTVVKAALLKFSLMCGFRTRGRLKTTEKQEAEALAGEFDIL